MNRYLSLPVALLLIAFITACEEDSVSEPPPTEETFSTTMVGHQGPSPVASQGRGEATFDVQDGSISYEIVVQDLFGVTQAHVHVGGSDASGPVVADLFHFSNIDGSDGTPEDIESETFTGTITADDIMPQEGVGFDGSFDAFVQRLSDGSLYINVHTLDNPGGEIRGQLQAGANNPPPSAPAPESFTAELDGSTEDVVTEASGEATITWNWSQREMQYEVTLQNIQNVTQGHVHRDQTTGPVVAFFSGEVGGNLHYTSAPNGEGQEEQAQTFENETLSGTIERDFFVDNFDGSFHQLLTLLRSGEAFVNVHTLDHPGGEIGGQLGNGGGSDGNGNGDDNGY